MIWGVMVMGVSRSVGVKLRVTRVMVEGWTTVRVRIMRGSVGVMGDGEG